MKKIEPYIGMPIRLGGNDDNRDGWTDRSAQSNMRSGQREEPAYQQMGRTVAASSVSGNLPLDKLPPAMAYVPMQEWNSTYPVEQGFDVGTLFPELNLPFRGYGNEVRR